MPQVSVIVPARNAAATIEATLAALRRQDLRGFELIVVDDASSDDTAAIAERAGATVVRHERQAGPAAARNSGAAAASGSLLAFTDADCEPSPGWLTAIEQGLAGAELVTGPIRPDPNAELGPFARTLHVDQDSPRFESANLAVTRELFERIGGFEAFTSDGGSGLRPRVQDGHFGEDAVFGWRARRLGARIAFVSDATVHHAVFPRGLAGYVAERWRMRFFPALVREVPEMRSALPLRLFVSNRTALFDLAALAILGALARRRVWPLIAAVPYVRRYLRTSGPLDRSLVAHNLGLIAGDALALAALVRGCVAARTVLL